MFKEQKKKEKKLTEAHVSQSSQLGTQEQTHKIYSPGLPLALTGGESLWPQSRENGENDVESTEVRNQTNHQGFHDSTTQ